MKVFWFGMAGMALVIMFFCNLPRNITRTVYNLFHKHKRRVRWNPIDHMYDPTEDFYND